MSLYSAFNSRAFPIGADGTPWEYLLALRDEAIATDTPIGWSTAYGDDRFDGFWVCTRYMEGKELFYKTKETSNRDVTWPSYGVPEARDLMLAGMDGERHKKYRGVVQKMFTRSAADAMADLLRRDVNNLIEQFIGEGEVDMVRSLTGKVPDRVTAIILGLSPEEGGDVARWVRAMAHQVFEDPAGAAVQLADMQDRFTELVAQRRDDPGEDVFSQLVHSKLNGRPLSTEELLDYFTIILLGAADTTANLMSTLIWHLAWDHTLRKRLAAEPSLWATACPEALRYYTPVHVFRAVLSDFSLGGVELKQGQHIALALPIMNRDPDVFADPDEFIPDRAANKHASFGFGVHHCIGARIELTVTLTELLRRIPDFSLHPTKKPQWKHGQVIGMHTALPVILSEKAP